MSSLSSNERHVLTSSCPCHSDWPDDLHWETISYLTPIENNSLNKDAIDYILTITKSSNRSVEEFLKTYNGSDQFRDALLRWQFSVVLNM